MHVCLLSRLAMRLGSRVYPLALRVHGFELARSLILEQFVPPVKNLFWLCSGHPDMSIVEMV